jgi:hypothetical protein
VGDLNCLHKVHIQTGLKLGYHTVRQREGERGREGEREREREGEREVHRVRI